MNFDPSSSSHWHRLLSNVEESGYAHVFAVLLAQQYRHNENQAGEAWHTADHNWLRYMRVELYELMEHYNSYKHWKAHKPDLAQARIELVDALIFAMSHAIKTGDVWAFCQRLGNYLAEAEAENKVDRHLRSEQQLAEDINITLEQVVSVSFRGVLDLDNLARLIVLLGLDAERFELLYQVKMALNHLRTENGYKQGHYIKTWFGVEDNEYVQEKVVDNAEMRLALAEVPDLQEALREVLHVFYDRVQEDAAQ